jgi:nitronate monooxygenase
VVAGPARREAIERAEAFCAAFGLQTPILLAPMAGACPPALSVAVAEAGGMGACGALLFSPTEIAQWAEDFRKASSRPFQINLWTADPAPRRDAAHEAEVARFVSRWTAPADPLVVAPRDFDAQFDAAVAAAPDAISSIMGLFPDRHVAALKEAQIPWLATATTLSEARRAAAAGADAIIAQGAEAGGHRGAFDMERAEQSAVGLFALAPAIADAVDLPVIAAGGIADARGVAAALTLGASAVMVGTAFLRAPEARIAPSWAANLGLAAPEDAVLTRAFSGRAGRALYTDYVAAAGAPAAPRPAPYPVQRALTQAMRGEGARLDDLARIQAWAGQSARHAETRPAGEITAALWSGARALLA